jgi:predicted alpha/beta hydrolase
MATAGTTPSHPLQVSCADGFVLHGDLWPPADGVEDLRATVLIAPATGVTARYYHRYAAYLARTGFTAVTFDYRGIGASTESVAASREARWADWGLLDIDAMLRWIRATGPTGQLLTVGHSFGGFGIALAATSAQVTRHLSIGGQHAYWLDYRPGHRTRMWGRWHLFMPATTVLCGHFPGRRLGWLEDLPRGIALDWARSRRDFPRIGIDDNQRAAIRLHLARFHAPTLAVSATDDPFATDAAVARAWAYSPHAPVHRWTLSPQDLDAPQLGHFGLLHDRFGSTFWPATADWLRNGTLPPRTTR